jgi:hypothetical protein
MKIPTRKAHRPIALDCRDPDHVRVIQWEQIGKQERADHIPDAREKVARPSLIAAEAQAQLFPD